MKIIITTTDREEIAKNIAEKCIEIGNSPCVNIIKNNTSIYRWKGKIEVQDEFLLLIKTVDEGKEKIVDLIKKYSNYEIPEILEIEGNILDEPYSKWFLEETYRGENRNSLNT
ncbi:divalent-cation tolerance protein CutA [Caldiplasma sukawensis]